MDRTLAGTVDIVPTILRAAGIQTSAPLEGRDLLSSPAPDAVFAQYAGLRYAIRTKDWKLIANLKPRSVELYDLQSDPAERNNVAARFPEEARTLEERLWNWRRSCRSFQSLTTPEVEMDDTARERLRELGYLE